MILGFGNNVVSSLAAEITANQTTIQVMPKDGAKFAKLLSSDYVNASTSLNVYAKITLTDAKETVFEICHLIAVNNDMLTVVRGQEGTTAKGWELNDVVANFATRGSENHFVQIEQLQSGNYTSVVAGGSANALTVELPATYFVNSSTDWVLRVPIVVYPIQNNTGAVTLQLAMGGRVLGTFPLYKGNKSELVANDLIKDAPILCVLDNTKSYFSILNPLDIYLGSRYLQKDQNGADVPDKDLFVKNVGAARAYSGSVHIGGNSEVWTTAQFISWLDGQKAFNHPYWMCKGSWTYANNKVITDTGCGNICLAGAVIEVMGIRNAMTIRVTTPSTTSGGGIPNAEFIYINHGDQYSPGWRRDFNTRNKPTAADTNALPITGGYLTGNVGFNNDSTLGWERYTDWAKIGFKNDSDGDADAFMWFETGDNGNEYFKWRHKHSGGTTNDWMTLKSDALRVAGQVIPTNYANFDARYLSPSNAYSKTESDARYVRDVRLGTNITNVIWGSGGGTCPKGHVLTGGNFDDDREYPIFAPIQKYINNTWYTVSQL